MAAQRSYLIVQRRVKRQCPVTMLMFFRAHGPHGRHEATRGTCNTLYRQVRVLLECPEMLATTRLSPLRFYPAFHRPQGMHGRKLVMAAGQCSLRFATEITPNIDAMDVWYVFQTHPVPKIQLLIYKVPVRCPSVVLVT